MSGMASRRQEHPAKGGPMIVEGAVVAIASASSSDESQLQILRSWTHSPATAVLLALAFVALAAVVFTPLGPRLLRRSPSGGWRIVVVALGVLGALSWVSHNWWFEVLLMVALWGCVVWFVVTSVGAAVVGVGRFANDLDPQKRAERQRGQVASAERGSDLDRVLDRMEDERRGE